MQASPSILRPSVASYPPALLASECFDDMHDSQDEMAYYSALPLELSHEITRKFDSSDRSALKHQRVHRHLTRWAAVCGAAAVLLTIVELGYGDSFIKPRLRASLGQWGIPGADWVLPVIELVLAVIVATIVLFGNISARKQKWLFRRHEAELCRLLRFRFLIRPDLWNGAAEQAKEWIERELAKIDALEGKDILRKAIEEPTPHGPFDVTMQHLPRRTLQLLVEYYLAKRLNPQREYLANRAQRNEFADRVWSFLPTKLFFGSVIAVALQFAVNAGAFAFYNKVDNGVFFTVFGAASLPVIATLVRTWRAAFEYSRNKSRFRAAQGALCQLEQSVLHDGIVALSTRNGGQPAGADAPVTTFREQTILKTHDIAALTIRFEEQRSTQDLKNSNGNAEVRAFAVLRDLCWCEYILENEHREWLRLMVETEWFG